MVSLTFGADCRVIGLIAGSVRALLGDRWRVSILWAHSDTRAISRGTSFTAAVSTSSTMSITRRRRPYDPDVRDQKPPRTDADELTTLQALLQYQRESVVRKVARLDDAAARQQFVETGTTLLWLVRHLARAEIVWIELRFAGRDVEIPADVVDPDDTLAAAVAAYRATWARVDAVVSSAPSLDEPCRNVGDGPLVNLRWVLAHLLEETARHAGHADIIRELIDGATGR
jgi:uncharacterized damage-inducible protein DinB